MFKSIVIIYKPTKRIEIEPLCFFSDIISKAYSSLHSKAKKGMSRRTNAISVIIAINFLFWKQGKKNT